MRSTHVTVHGEVQGVFYRSSAEERATSLGVAGWVRNADDGTVEMVVEGPEDAVEQMLAWAREGSEQARVTDVDVADQETQGLSGFAQV